MLSVIHKLPKENFSLIIDRYSLLSQRYDQLNFHEVMETYRQVKWHYIIYNNPFICKFHTLTEQGSNFKLAETYPLYKKDPFFKLHLQGACFTKTIFYNHRTNK